MADEPKPAETQTVIEKKPINHLTFVAWAFIFIGVLALIQTVQATINNPPAAPNFLMVFMVVGWGLLKRKAMWRTFALSCSYVFLVFTLGQMFFFVRSGATFETLLDGIIFWAIGILMILAGGYAIWALQTKAVRDQFKSKL